MDPAALQPDHQALGPSRRVLPADSASQRSAQLRGDPVLRCVGRQGGEVHPLQLEPGADRPIGLCVQLNRPRLAFWISYLPLEPELGPTPEARPAHQAADRLDTNAGGLREGRVANAEENGSVANLHGADGKRTLEPGAGRFIESLDGVPQVGFAVRPRSRSSRALDAEAGPLEGDPVEPEAGHHQGNRVQMGLEAFDPQPASRRCRLHLHPVGLQDQTPA